MHDGRLTAAADRLHDSQATRHGDAAWLARALQASRADTLALFEVLEQSLPSLAVPKAETLNPPLWELGHIGWFQEFWIERNPQRSAGWRADPQAPRGPSARPGADALYDSSRVPHASRWHLPLPGADATRADLARQLDQTLAWLDQASADAADRDDALYFFRLALVHEDMHHEAALYMAQALGVPVHDPRWQPPRLPDPAAPLSFPAGLWRLGSDDRPGFAFDNELGAHEVTMPAFEIDSQVLRWAEFLPFIEAGGYEDERWWDEAGRRWRDAQRSPAAGLAPRDLRRDGSGWLCRRGAAWRALEPSEPARHLSQHEAEAWCRWAGRRLPTEAEWERAAISRPSDFAWGSVWEWTASPFAPYPGFTPHPYRDYSAPWFDGRPVLRGASFMTQPRMRHPRYRNYFRPHRNDVPAGFRSCAL